MKFLKSCILFLLLATIVSASHNKIHHYNEEPTEKPPPAWHGYGQRLYSDLFVPQAKKQAFDKIDRMYGDKDKGKENPNAQQFEQLTNDAVNAIDNWGTDLHQTLADFRQDIIRNARELAFENRYFDYQSEEFVVNALLDTYLDYRKEMQLVRESYIDGLAEFAATDLTDQLNRFHDNNFQKYQDTKRIIDYLKDYATKKSNLFARTILYKFYCKHTGILVKGWIIGTFGLDFYRAHKKPEEHVNSQQKIVTDSLNKNVKSATDAIKELIDSIPNTNSVDKNFFEDFNVPLADDEVGKKPDTELGYNCGTDLTKSNCNHTMNYPIYMFLMGSKANVEGNNVITGISFGVLGATVVIKIEESKLLKEGEIDKGTRKWKDIDHISADDAVSKELMFLKESIYLKPLQAKSPEYVMTSIKFVRVDDRSTGLEATFHKFDFSTGALNKDDQYTANNYDAAQHYEAKANTVTSSQGVTSEDSALTGVSFDVKETAPKKAITQVHSVDYGHFLNLEKVTVSGNVPSP